MPIRSQHRVPHLYRLCAASPKSYSQHGLTMVELLVAMVISLFISLAAISALLISRQGFSAVDASSQLRDNGRFVADLIQRIGVQSGFKDAPYAAAAPIAPGGVVGLAANPEPDVKGFNSALLDATSPLTAFTARAANTDGSDILILRYQAVETFPGSGITDRSMIDCAGNASTTPPIDKYDRVPSILHVAVSTDEPSLMCTTINASTGAVTTQPIIRGVENFQVLYGVDGVNAGVAPTGVTDTVPDSYLRADQLDVAGNSVATNANWQRVRSIRVGMVLRGPLNSALDRTAQTFYPLGPARSSSTGAVGSAMSSANDNGSIFAPTPDGRLRQVVTFTVHLRNAQNL
jgi:type IV pilus assembly protein PilW